MLSCKTWGIDADLWLLGRCIFVVCDIEIEEDAILQ